MLRATDTPRTPRLTPELWAMVSLHLKPRHLSKLMLTNKQIKAAVDVDPYWARVAAHLMWRNEEMLELSDDEDMQSYRSLPPPCPNLFYLVNAQGGYYQGMECFLLRLRQLLAQGYTFSEKWGEFADAPLPAIVRLYDRFRAIDMDEDELFDKDEELSMKQIAQRECAQMAPQDPSLREFVHTIEDDPMPAEHKRRFMEALDVMMWKMTPGTQHPRPRTLWVKDVPNGPWLNIYRHVCKFD
jgi:hypothetical protein